MKNRSEGAFNGVRHGDGRRRFMAMLTALVLFLSFSDVGHALNALESETESKNKKEIKPLCGLTEHVHTREAGCYKGGHLICKKKAHVHTEECEDPDLKGKPAKADEDAAKAGDTKAGGADKAATDKAPDKDDTADARTDDRSVKAIDPDDEAGSDDDDATDGKEATREEKWAKLLEAVEELPEFFFGDEEEPDGFLSEMESDESTLDQYVYDLGGQGSVMLSGILEKVGLDIDIRDIVEMGLIEDIDGRSDQLEIIMRGGDYEIRVRRDFALAELFIETQDGLWVIGLTEGRADDPAPAVASVDAPDDAVDADVPVEETTEDDATDGSVDEKVDVSTDDQAGEMHDKPVDVPADETADQSADEQTEEPTEDQIEDKAEESADEVTKERTEDQTEEPVGEQTDEPTKASSDEPTEDAADVDVSADNATEDDATDEPAEEPTDEVTDEPAEGQTDEPADEQTDEPTNASSDEPSEDAVDVDVPADVTTEDEATDEPADEVTEEPAEDQTVEPTDEHADEPADDATEDESTDEPAEGQTDEPADEQTEEPAEDQTVEPTDEHADEPADEQTDEPADETTEGQTDEPVEDQTDEPADDQTDEPTDETTEGQTDEPADEQTDEPAEGQTDEPVEDQTDEPADDQTDEPTEDQTDEPTDESTDEPTEGQTDETAEGQTDAPAEEDGEPFPEQQFSEASEEVQVRVFAPQGALPTGTRMRVSEVDEAEILDAVTAVVEAPVKRVHAVDISFLDADELEIEPLAPVTVRLAVGAIGEGEAVRIVHIGDDGRAELVGNAEAHAAGDDDLQAEGDGAGAEAGADDTADDSASDEGSGVDGPSAEDTGTDGASDEKTEDDGLSADDADADADVAAADVDDVSDEDANVSTLGTDDADEDTAAHEDEENGLTITGYEAVPDEILEIVFDEDEFSIYAVVVIDVTPPQPLPEYAARFDMSGVEPPVSLAALIERTRTSDGETVRWAEAPGADATETAGGEVNTADATETAGVEAQTADADAQETAGAASLSGGYEIEHDAEVLSIEGDVVMPLTGIEETTITVTAEDAVFRLTLANWGPWMTGSFTVPVEGADYALSISVPGTARLPWSAVFAARAVNDNAYEDAAINAFATDVSVTEVLALFDLTIYDGESIIQPEAPLAIGIDLSGAIEPETEVCAIHFPGTGPQPVRSNMRMAYARGRLRSEPTIAKEEIEAVNDGGVISFAAASFSYYAIVGRTLIKYVLASDGNTYRISVTYGADAGVPDGAELDVSEVTEGHPAYGKSFGEYVADADDALGENEKVTFARFFDIRIVKDGEPIQPEKPVDVLIELADALDEGVKAVHFEHAEAGEETGTPVLLDAERADAEELTDAVSFETDGFSVFGVIMTLETTVITADGETYRITVKYGPDAGVPEGARLEAGEILRREEDVDSEAEDGEKADAEYDIYLEKTREALGLEAGPFKYARFFDIKIVDGNGEKVEITAPVDVRIELADKESAEEAEENTRVVHFADESDAGSVVDAVTDGQTVRFEADGFSAYAIVEGPEPIELGWSKVRSIDELNESGFYIGQTRGYYMMDEIINDGKRIGIRKTKPDNSVPLTSGDRVASLYCFEKIENTQDQFYIYLKGSDPKTYVVANTSSRSLLFGQNENDKMAFTVVQNSDGSFFIKTGGWYWNMQGSDNGERFCVYNEGNGDSKLYVWNQRDEVTGDPYGLDDGNTYGLMSWNGGVAGKALMTSASKAGALDAKALTVMSKAGNKDQLFVPSESDISMWRFDWISEDKYRLSAVVSGSRKYLRIDASGVSLVDAEAEASDIQVCPGTGIHKGEICLKCGNTALTFSGTVEGGFSVGGEVGSEWLHLLGPGELTNEHLMTYSASKVSVSDPGITNGSRIIVYTRYWNETTKKYDYYAIDHDGTLVRVYDSGDVIEWASGQLNTLLWNFVEYYWEGTTDPNFYYELYNQYSKKYVAPQSTGDQVLSADTLGINLNGRRDGKYYSPILAWDEEDYAYVGLKVEDGRLVVCPRSEAMDFYFAVMQDMNVDDDLTTVPTVDHTQYGIKMKIKDFGTRAEMSDFLGSNDGGAVYTLVQGLLSSDLKANGYPTAKGGSLAQMYAGAEEVNHLFIESAYAETGYYEFDSSENFATLKGETGGDFTVYKELGSYDSASERDTLRHGQFFPFNDLEPGVFCSVHSQNLYSTTGGQLPNSDPRKYEQLYSLEHDGEKVNTYFGVELEASFTQTPSGLDAWGHDIIFDFTGDDDFWLYVDGELVIDLGGIHSAVPGSANFRTGEVNVNGTRTTLRDLFYNNYLRRDNHTAAQAQAYVDGIFTQNDEGKWVFKDGTQHTMKVFYMERGAGASNLKMRFNLAAIKKGTAQLTKVLKGADEANIMAEFPYQIWYAIRNKKTGKVHGEAQLTNAEPDSVYNTDHVFYKDTIQPAASEARIEIDGVEYKHVFFLKPDETVDIDFPEIELRDDEELVYWIVECGVDTEIYSSVCADGAVIEGVAVAGSDRKDFPIGYATTDQRPTVTYENEVDPDALRTLTLKKVLYRADGETPITAAEDDTEFTFRLYLASENGTPALVNMYPYHVKDPNGNYCKRNKTTGGKFVTIGGGISDYSQLTGEQRKEATFVTSGYGTIADIPVGYTVEIRDVLVGTQYRIQERPGEIPDGYSFQKYAYYENGEPQPYTIEVNGEAVAPSAWAGVEGKIKTRTDPHVDICNMKGWGLRINKTWTDADYMSERNDTYFGVYVQDGDGLDFLDDTLMRMPYKAKPQTLYWYFKTLPIENTSLADYVIREVKIVSGTPEFDSDAADDPNDPNAGDRVINEGALAFSAVEAGETITLNGKQKGETTSSGFTYTVRYETGDIPSDSNVRVDTAANDRPGIIIMKQDWSGQPLAGASFELRDDAGGLIGSFTSDDEGMVTTAFLSPDKAYALTETLAPKPYRGPDAPLTITLANGGVTVDGPEGYYELIANSGGALPTLVVKNRPFTLKAVKKDGDTQQPMQGVTFALHKQHTVDGVTQFDTSPLDGCASLVTDEDGVVPNIVETLPAGVYELREIAPKEHYDPISGYIHFTITEAGAVTLGLMKDDGQLDTPDGVTLTETETGDAEGTLAYEIDIGNFRKTDVTIKKVDADGAPLLGAKFEFSRYDDASGDAESGDGESGDGENDKWKPVEGQGVIDLTANAQITIEKLTAGRYRLHESQAPTGCSVLPEDVFFRIALSEDGIAVTLTDAEGNDIETQANVTLSDTTITITNMAGFTLPSTGGAGTGPIRLLGFLLIALAGAALLIGRRRRRAENR